MFSRPPLSDKLLGPGGISTSWTRHLDSQYNYLNTNLSPSGYVQPNLSTAASTAQTNTKPGTTIFNTDLNKIQVWTGSTWETVTSA